MYLKLSVNELFDNSWLLRVKHKHVNNLAVLFCISRYNCTPPDILYNTLIDVLIYNIVLTRITDMQLREADLLTECIMMRDGLMLLPDCFTANDINAVIDCLCSDGSLTYAWHFTIEFFLLFLLFFIITFVLRVRYA